MLGLPPRLRTLLLIVLAACGSPAAAQFDLDFSDALGAGADPVELTAQLAPADEASRATLVLTATIQPGWHIYSITQPPGGPMTTAVQLDASPQFRLAGEIAETPNYEVHFDENFPGVEMREIEEQAVWSAPLILDAGPAGGTVRVTGSVRLQACDKTCVPLTLKFTAEAEAPPTKAPLTKTPLAGGDPGAAPADGTTPTGPAGAGPPGALSAGDSTSGQPASDALYNLGAIELADLEAGGSLAWYLTLAFAGGLALNLMPCVLPVIGLKVMSFVEQAGKSRGHAFALNAWYSLGIISVFLVLAVLAILAGLSWGEQFGSETFNVVMASIVFVMALSLLGVWEIPIPGFIGSGKAQEAASKEGATGAFLKGVVTTLLATPCIGPGMGAALGWAVKQPPTSTLAVFFMLGVGMSSPYLLIGLFPKLVSFLPKPGAWMETFKQLMGFVLIGTVLFLLGILPTHSLLPTLALFTGLALACWAYSKTPMTATPSEHRQTWGLCAAIVAGSAVFAFGFLGPLLNQEADEAWRPFSLAALKQVAVDDGKTVLVDFSADWCTNCKVLENTVLHTEPVEAAIKRAGVVTMYADYTDIPPEIEQTIRALRANGVPVIAIFPGGAPYRPIVFRDGYTQNQIIDGINRATSASVEKVATR